MAIRKNNRVSLTRFYGDLTWAGIYEICYRNCEIYIVYEIIYDLFHKINTA